MAPLLIRWSLATPVIVPDVPIHSDALLSWARVDEDRERGAADPIAAQHDLPLDIHRSGDRWCFKASWVRFNWSGQPRAFHYARRSDPLELTQVYLDGVLGARKPWWSPGSGSTKGFSILRQERLASSAEAFVVGDLEKVADLLKRIRSIGKLRRNCKGAVLGVEVCEISDAECHWWLRNLPDNEMAIEGAYGEGQLLSPYWKRDTSTVFVPFARDF